ncbi:MULTISPECIES: STAS domain-containing protein [unclassified Virgibacillus]|uniref:STAS domain-containing protein n=1 Tax=unclassified Virgibacillus TaxID=2620237 RepID=UPI0024DE9B9B|nr:STAS domain-containing protein [Virgibacillus sp. LDC-1]
MNLSIDVVEIAEGSVVNLVGEIDAYTAPNLKNALLPLTKKENNLVQVDMEQVSYMDSTGLGVFVNVLKSSKEHGSKLQLVNLQERVFRLFKITGLHEIMDINAVIRGGKG